MIRFVVGNQGDEHALVVAYLHATNRSDYELLSTLVTQDFELVMGEQTVTGIDNVIALRDLSI